VLIANVIEMKDAKGGTKAPDTTLWREHLHAATMVGRLASAKVATDLGYGIEADGGPTGKLGHWKISGIPDAALAVHSKRAAEINQAVHDRGFGTYQARQVAARETRKQKRHTSVAAMLPMWRGELEAAGFPPLELSASIERAGQEYQRTHSSLSRLSSRALSTLATDILGANGTLSDRKVFSQRDVIIAVTPHLYGLPAAELDRVVARVLRDPEAIAPGLRAGLFDGHRAGRRTGHREGGGPRCGEHRRGQGDGRGGRGGPYSEAPGARCSADRRAGGGGDGDHHVGPGRGAGRGRGRIGQNDSHGCGP
jgi:hypothetical protein